jgi:hypothetical protein
MQRKKRISADMVAGRIRASSVARLETALAEYEAFDLRLPIALMIAQPHVGWAALFATLAATPALDGCGSGGSSSGPPDAAPPASDAAADVHVAEASPADAAPEAASESAAPETGVPDALTTDAAQGCTFAPPVAYASGSLPTSVAIADFNADGRLDLVATNNQATNVSVFLNSGAGAFAPQVAYSVPGLPIAAAVRDLDGDGLVDVALALSVPNTAGETVAVLLNKAGGGFASATTYPGGPNPESIAIGDVSGDGIPDLATGNFFDGMGNVGTKASVLFNVGKGAFGAPAAYDVGISPAGVALADLNGDGHADLAVANSGSSSLGVLLNASGTLGSQVTYTTGTSPAALAVADLNGDGRLDVIVADYGSIDVSVFLNAGSGTFAPKVTYPLGGGNKPTAIAVGDLTGDGLLDLALVGNSGNVEIFANAGGGTFASAGTYPVGDRPEGLAIGDLNGDGHPDLAVSNYLADTVSVILAKCP